MSRDTPLPLRFKRVSFLAPFNSRHTVVLVARLLVIVVLVTRLLLVAPSSPPLLR